MSSATPSALPQPPLLVITPSRAPTPMEMEAREKGEGERERDCVEADKWGSYVSLWEGEGQEEHFCTYERKHRVVCTSTPRPKDSIGIPSVVFQTQIVMVSSLLGEK